jgi:hypothetical protein
MTTQASEFNEKGYVLTRDLLTEDAVEQMVRCLDALSQHCRGIGGWTFPDGLAQNRAFWPLIFNERLLATVRELIGPNIRFLQHNDLHVGFSSLNWHRDSVSRRVGHGSDWDEIEPYRIVRIGFYLQPRITSFHLGLLPGTHRLPHPSDLSERHRLEKMVGTISLLRRIILGRNVSPETAEWLAPAAGDAVIFDPRVLHTGSHANGPKYSVFLAYGVPNRHYIDHAIYYRFLRPELSYRQMHASLIARLQEEGLYQEVERPTDEVPDATLPGIVQSLIARHIRHQLDNRHKTFS